MEKCQANSIRKHIAGLLTQHLGRTGMSFEKAGALVGRTPNAVRSWADGTNDAPYFAVMMIAHECGFVSEALEVLGYLALQPNRVEFNGNVGNSVLSTSAAEFAKAMEDGYVDHHEMPGVMNAMRRAFQWCGGAINAVSQ